MFLITGLGNPGPKYQMTRHNLGFLLIDELSKKWGIPESGWSEKNESTNAKLDRSNREILLVKPLTFMNLSGQAVSLWMQFFKIPKENLLVLVDDVAIPFGTMRLRPGGSDGGHNGLKSIDASIGSDYARLRLGVGDPGTPIPLEKFVLGKFTTDEQKRLPDLLPAMAECVDDFIEKGIATAMNLWNGKKL